jgi:hypothetical protein
VIEKGSAAQPPLAGLSKFATLRFMTCILHCPNPECPKDWEKLPQAGETDIRVCTECMKAVYRCDSQENAKLREEAGHRAAIPE